MELKKRIFCCCHKNSLHVFYQLFRANGEKLAIYRTSKCMSTSKMAKFGMNEVCFLDVASECGALYQL